MFFISWNTYKQSLAKIFNLGIHLFVDFCMQIPQEIFTKFHDVKLWKKKKDCRVTVKISVVYIHFF